MRVAGLLTSAHARGDRTEITNLEYELARLGREHAESSRKLARPLPMLKEQMTSSASDLDAASRELTARGEI